MFAPRPENRPDVGAAEELELDNRLGLVVAGVGPEMAEVDAGCIDGVPGAAVAKLKADLEELEV